jgi:hypothetical protein
VSPVDAADAYIDTQWSNTREYIQMMDEEYAPLKELRGDAVRGTGFKPYQRHRYFVEPRLDPVTGDLPLNARWEAFAELQDMEQRYGTRSNTWFTIGPINVAGRCLAIETHPTDPYLVYAGFASGGIWKSTNGGNEWDPIGDFLPTLAVGAIEIDTSNPDRIWMGTGEGWGNVDAVHGVGVMVSTDAGVTWEHTTWQYDLSSGRDVYELEYNPATGTLMVAADNGLWRSTDEGVTWTEVKESGHWKDIELKKGSSNVMFAVVHQSGEFGFHRSTDDGATWEWITNGTPTTPMGNCRFALTDDDPNYIYWGMDVGNNAMKIYKSTNGGDSFSQVHYGGHYGGQGWYNITISVDPANRNRVFSGGIYFYRSDNGGSSFTGTGSSIHVDHHATWWAPSDPSIFYVGTDGGVWRSDNSGASYVPKNAGLVTMQFYAMNQSESLHTKAMGGTQDNGTYVYNNNLNWQYSLGGDGFHCEIDHNQPNTCYAELYFGQHYRSLTGGGGMVPKNSGITEQGPWDTPTHMDFANPYHIWTAHTTRIFKTTNRMDNWFWTNNPSPLSEGVSIHQCRNQTDNVVVVGRSKVWLTTDSGSSWIDRTSGMSTGASISDVHVHPNDPNIMLVTCRTYNAYVPKVHKTTDQGLTWFASDDGLPVEPANTIEIDPSNPDYYFVGTDLGIYVSSDAGASWQPFNTGLPHVVMADLRILDPARIMRVATHGRGMWEVDISELMAVDDTRPEVEPIALRVFGNPASDHVSLRFGLRRAGNVSIGLYDVQGRQLKSLMNEYRPAIMDDVEVDLSDLPSGVYFARMQADGHSVSRKIIVE